VDKPGAIARLCRVADGGRGRSSNQTDHSTRSMKKKHDPPPAADRLPAMFVGDEELAAAPVIPAQALVAGAREAAGMLPQDLRVVIEGTTTHRVPFVGAAVLAVAVFALGIFKNTVLMPDVAQYRAFYTALLGACVLIGGLGYRLFARHRKEYRLADDGIVLNAWHGTDSRPWVTRIPWTEIEDYTVSLDGETLYLRVESVRGYTISLQDRPPRLSTREFIRRFMDEAGRHPRAVRPEPVVSVPDGDIHHDISATGCLGYTLLTVVGMIVSNLVEISSTQAAVGWVAVCVIVFSLGLWSTLDDYDVAVADRDSRRLIARLRRWLRRVLGIRPT
jgi:hypothetical protein